MAKKKPPRGAQVAAGLLAVAVGLGIAAIAASHIGKAPDKPALDAITGMIAGLCVVFTGAILVVPERQTGLRALIGALMVTSIALLFDWVAFGPGERHAASTVASANASARSHFWEVPGRVLLVSGALLFNLMALWAWLRALWRKSARA